MRNEQCNWATVHHRRFSSAAEACGSNGMDKTINYIYIFIIRFSIFLLVRIGILNSNLVATEAKY